MKPLRLLVLLFVVTAVAVAQRSPSPSPAPSSPTPSSPSSTSSGSMSQSHSSAPSSGGGSQSHAGPASSGGGGGGSARSSGGNPAGAGRSDMNSGRSNAGAGSHGNANSAPRSDHGFNGTRGNATSNDRHGKSNSNAIKPEVFRGRDGDVSRSGKQPTLGNIAPDARRDHKSDVTRTGKPVHESTATRETQTPKRFHWFWQKRKDDRTKEFAKSGHPELKKPIPCKGINCKPVCPTGQTAGEAGGCVPVTPIHPSCDGTVDSHGNCIPNESATDPCTNNGVYNPGCSQYQNRLTRRPDCSGEASRAASLRHDIEILEQRVQLVCAQDPTGPICRDAQEELRRAQEQLMESQRQYQYCQSTRTQYP